MMVVYKTPSKEIQEIILASVTYETVIDGLNGYFASEPRNDYITVKMASNDRDSALYEAEAWADILITWLRTEHGIFYYPGMETRYAKMEKIPPPFFFTKRMMNEGALNSLKKLYKNVTGEEDETSSPTLMASTVSFNFSNKDRMISVLKEQNELLEGEVRQFNRDYIMNCIRQEPSQNGFDLPRACQDLIEDLKKREIEIKELKERIAELESNFKAVCDEDDIFRTRALKAEEEIRKLNAELATKWTKTSLINWLQQRARHKGVELDDAFLYSDDAQYEWTDIIDFLFDEIVKMRQEIKEIRKKYWNDLRDIYKALGCDRMNGNVDGFAKAVKARAEYVESLSRNTEREAPKSGINQLIRDYCIKNDIVAPSRYLSDKACVEYLFSLIEQRDRSFAILQELYRDIFKKQPNGLSAKDIATKILDKVLETEDLLHKSVDSVNKECKAVGRQMVDDYKLKLKDYILHDIKKRGYRYDGLKTKSVEDIVDWIITMATCANNSHISDRIHEICNAKEVELDDAFLYDDDYTWEDLVGFLCEEIRKLKIEVEDVQEKTRKECYDYLWNALNKLSPECDALKIDHYEDLVDRIFFEMCFVTENCKQCQRKHSTEKFDYIRRTNKAEEELKKLRSANEANNDVIKKLKELFNEINKEEDGEWFKP